MKQLRIAIIAWASLLAVFVSSNAQGVTYANSSYTYSWIDPIAGGHTRVGYNTAPYKFNGGGSTGCGTTPPVLDDTISDAIPIGFTFWFAGNSFTTLRIQSNGRIQFNNTTCGFGTQQMGPPQIFTYLYPSASNYYAYDPNMNNTIKLFGVDLDPTDLDDPGTGYPAARTTCRRSTNNCGVYIKTLGTAPYRTFVVTWNNVPEWVNFSNTSGNFSMQVVLQENGEFIFQYKDVQHTNGTGIAETGWQVDSQDYDVLQYAAGTEPKPDPVHNSGIAVKFYIPAPVAEYRMEQTSWTTSGNPVLDTSGNLRHASLVTAGSGTAPTLDTGKVCRGGVIADNNNATDIGAITTPFSMQTVGSQGTITFWYYEKSGNRMLLDASSVSSTGGASRWFYVMRTNNRQLKFVLYDNAGNRYESITGSNVLSNPNNWDHIGVSWNLNTKSGSNQDRILLWINGNLVTTTTFTAPQGIASQITTLYIGDNRSTLGVEDTSGNPTTGNSNLRGTGQSAGSTIDEVRIYNFESGKGLVQRDMNQASACLAHYAIGLNGLAAGTNDTNGSCTSNTVTITAHDSSHGTVLMPNNTTTINLSTSTGTGTWALSQGYGTLTPGSGGTATYRFNGEYQVVLTLSGVTGGTVNINVTDGQIVEATTEDPTLTVSCSTNASSFNCLDGSIGTLNDYSGSNARLYTKLAGTAFNFDIAALKSDGTLETNYVGSGGSAKTVTLDLVDNSTQDGITSCTLGGACTTTCGTKIGNSYTIRFPASNTTGRSKINAATDLPLAITVNSAYKNVICRVSESATNLVRCSSDAFAIRPKSLTLATTTTMATPPSATAAHTIQAGTAFTVTAASTPATYSGTLTQDGGKLTAQKTDDDTTSAAGGTVGTLAPATLTANDTPSAANASYTEVGYVYLGPGTYRDDSFADIDKGYPKPPAVPTDCDQKKTCDCISDPTIDDDKDGIPDYISDTLVNNRYGCSVGNTATYSFGRFIPHHFKTTVTQGCAAGTFTYSGQAFTATVTAQNKDGGTTSNYSGKFSKAVTLSDANASTSGTLASNTINANSFASGTKSANPIYTLTTAASGPVDITIRAAEDTNNDDVTSKDFGEDTAKVRSGRLRLANAYGSELASLPLTALIEYYKGSYWAINTADSCTTFAALAGPTGAIDMNPSASGKTTPRCNVSDRSCTTTSGLACNSATTVTAGNVGLCLSAPTVSSAGYVDVTFSPPTYLQAAGSGARLTGRANFGVYSQQGSSKKMIHRREVR